MADTQKPSRSDDDIDLGELLGTLVDNRWIIAAITAVALITSVAYALFATPIYQANAVIQVEQKVPQLPGLSALSQTLGASSSEATTEIALITSRSVLSKTVDDLGLSIESAPMRFPLFGGYLARRFVSVDDDGVAPARLGTTKYDWGGSVIHVDTFDVSSRLNDRAFTVVAGTGNTFTLLDPDGAKLLTGVVGSPAAVKGIKINVALLRANPGTQFTVVHHKPFDVINQLQQDLTAIEQGKDSGIIQVTYQEADAELAQKLVDSVTKGYVRQNVERNSAEAAQSLTFVKEQLPKIRQQLEKATADLNKFQTTAKSVDITMQTKGLLEQEVAIESSVQQLRLQQADLARRYTEKHPAYKALIEQIEQLQAQKAGIDKQVGNLPDTQQELLRLTRDVQVSNETYTGLLNQAQQLDIARAGTVGNVRIVDPASVDDGHPVKPRRMVVVFGGTLLGGMLAVGFVFLRNMLNRGVEDPGDIEKLGLPVYASIPTSDAEKHDVSRGARRVSDGRQHLLVVNEPADLASEAMRSLRTSMHFAQLEARNNIIMISGCSPAAGKTFVSANYAAVTAQSGSRVLLIDGDMRKGALHKVIGGRPEIGLSEYIAGTATLDQVVRAVANIDGFSFIARGKVPPNPSELLMNSRFRTLLETLSSQYDVIVVDTPPILAVTDAAIIGAHAGTSLLVIRFGLNQPREVELARQRFEQNKIEIKGAIFNAVEKRATGYYSYGYYDYKSAT